MRWILFLCMLIAVNVNAGYIRGGSLTETEAEAKYFQKTGGEISGDTEINGALDVSGNLTTEDNMYVAGTSGDSRLYLSATNGGESVESSLRFGNDLGETRSWIFHTSSDYTGGSNDTLYIKNNNAGVTIDAGNGEPVQINSDTKISGTLDVYDTAKFDDNVGIGTDSPSKLLDIHGESVGIKLTETTDSSNVAWQYAGLRNFEFALSSSSDYTTTFKNYSTGNHNLVVDGKVGIGTDNPISKLHIATTNADARITASTTYATGDAQILLQSLATRSGAVVFNDGASPGMVQYTHNDDKMLLKAGGDTVMTLHDGKAGLGTTDPVCALEVIGQNSAGSQGFLNSAGFNLRSSSGASYGIISMGTDTSNNYNWIRSSDNGGASVPFKFYGSAITEYGTLDANGLALGATNAGSKLDIVGPKGSQLRLSDTTSDSTEKASYVVSRHYNNAQDDVTLLFGSMTSAGNSVRVGGGSGFANAATEIKFYTAANTTTADGSVRMAIDSDGDTTMYGALNVSNIVNIVTAEHADNAAAVSAGLAIGTIYRTGDLLKIVH